MVLESHLGDQSNHWISLAAAAPHELMVFFSSQVLDGLLAQCGTVENCEQGDALKALDYSNSKFQLVIIRFWENDSERIVIELSFMEFKNVVERMNEQNSD